MVSSREFRYLRISVTARCDHACIYCRRPGDAADPAVRELSPEDVERVVRAAAFRGIRAVRITGGEPLLRADLVEIVERIHRVESVEDISLTTNGVALESLARALRQAGVRRVNVHLPSLKSESYEKITGVKDLDRVLAGIHAARAAGIAPVKTNTVLVRGVNDGEWAEIIEWTNRHSLVPRFIEMMSQPGIYPDGTPVTCGELLERIRRRWRDVRQVPTRRFPGYGPSRYFEIPNVGMVGLICSCTRPDCERCTRLRLSADGRLRACLMSEETFLLDGVMNCPPEAHEWDELFARARDAKPAWGGQTIRAPMVTIGG